MSAVTKGGTIIMDMAYKNEHLRFALPSSIYMSFDVPAFSLPKSMTGDLLAEKTYEYEEEHKRKCADIIYFHCSE